jgi:hypothetical protein
MGENETKEQVHKESVAKATGISKEILSIIQTEQTGFLVSISRTVKTGKTASELSSVKMEGYARDLQGAGEVAKALDGATMEFIKTEAGFYGIDLKAGAKKE